MKKILLFCFTVLLSLAASGQITVSGVYEEITPPAGLDLNYVYVFKSLSGASITYSEPGKSITPYMYQNSESDETPVAPATANSCTISNLQDGRGYIFKGGTKDVAVWVIDYSLHEPVLTSIAVDESGNNCNGLKLLINKTDGDLIYKDINGISRVISRKYTIEYDDLEWSDASKTFINKPVQIEDEVGSEKIVDPTIIEKTTFVLKGDQFAKSFGVTKQVSSAEYTSVAVSAYLVAEHDGNDITAELNGGGTEKSAPYEVYFKAVASPAVNYYQIGIYNMNNPDIPLIERTEDDMDYEFIHAGNHEIHLKVANSNAGCEGTVANNPLKLNISISEIDAPNFFSPGDSPGSNDEFRVKHKSIIEFKCTIFNRWGVKIYEWTDPTKGWDGKHNGRYVAPGVYFYVIQAKGSEGKVHKKKGDINILRSK